MPRLYNVKITIPFLDADATCIDLFFRRGMPHGYDNDYGKDLAELLPHNYKAQ
jgi:hypothetical protein